MTFPAVATTSNGSTNGSGANTTSHTLNYPSGVASGDLVVAHAVFDASPSVTWASGWNSLYSAAHSGSSIGNEVHWREADGTEGASITVTTGASEADSWEMFRVTGAEDPDTQAPELAAFDSTSDSTTPDPPSLTPTGGAKDYLWLVFAGNDTGNQSYSVFPYASNNIDEGGGNTGNDVSTGACSTTSNAASLNPGTFTIGASRPSTAITLAVHPVGAGSTVEASISESVDLADAYAAAGFMRGAVAEPVDLNDSNTAILTSVAAISEAVDLGESWAVIAQVIAATSENVDLGDSWTTGGLVAAALSENVDLASTFASAVIASASVSEQTDLTDLYGVVLNATASLSEPVDLASAYSALLQAGASISEAITLASTFASTAGEVAAAVRILVEARNRRIVVEPRERRFIAAARKRRIDVKKLN